MGNTNVMLDESAKDAWTKLVTVGIVNGIRGLSQMVEQDIQATSLTTKHIPIKDAADLLGGSEILTVGIYLRVSGAADGHMVLVYQPEVAFEFVDMLMGDPAGTTQSLEEMAESALGELGNIMGSFFLTALADATGLQLTPSPPAVMMDMAGAILDIALADIFQEADEVLIVEAIFGTQDRQINGTFLVMPSLDLQKILLEHWDPS